MDNQKENKYPMTEMIDAARDTVKQVNEFEEDLKSLHKKMMALSASVLQFRTKRLDVHPRGKNGLNDEQKEFLKRTSAVLDRLVDYQTAIDLLGRGLEKIAVDQVIEQEALTVMNQAGLHTEGQVQTMKENVAKKQTRQEGLPFRIRGEGYRDGGVDKVMNAAARQGDIQVIKSRAQCGIVRS